MKKIISLMLTILMLLSLCACSNGHEKNTDKKEETSNLGSETFDSFVAGFGKVDVTPFAPTYLGSYGDSMNRLSTGVKDNFYALTVALSDTAGNTLLLIVTDLSWGHITHTAKLRAAVTEKYGIPGEYVMLGGTHNHNGPDWYSEASETDKNISYLELWFDGVMDSIEMALKDRKPAIMQVGRTETENIGFVRRYWRADGNLAGGGTQSLYVSSNSPIVSHESEGDEEVQMVKLVREDAKDILIGQWQNHGCHMGNTTIASTDWIGPMREKVEETLDCHYIYMQGAAGNMATESRIESEYPEAKSVDEVGEAVADVIIEAYNKSDVFKNVNTGEIKTKQEQFSAVGKVEGGAWTGELNTLSIGDVSVVTFPVEVFAETGMEIKEGSPYEMTLLMGYTNGIHGYIATREAYNNGGYEAHSRGEADTAERLVETYLNSLNELHK